MFKKRFTFSQLVRIMKYPKLPRKLKKHFHRLRSQRPHKRDIKAMVVGE